MSKLKLIADSGGGSVSLKGPATTTANADLEFTVPDVATGSSVVTADSSGHVSLADSKKIKLGTGGDLQIYHDGTDSYVKEGTGDLILQSTADDIIMRAVDDIHIQTGSSSDLSIFCAAGGEVSLYHNATKQCETSADGLAFPSGKGINFNATADASGTGVTAGSETFDDYEEGVWAAQVNTGVTNTQTFDQTARYTKIGRIVHCHFLLQWSGAGDSNQVTFTGLPFTSSNISAHGGGSVLWTNVPALEDYDHICILVNINATTIQLQQSSSNAVTGSGGWTNKALYGVFTYEAA